MAGARRSETTAPAGDLPDEIYIAFVDGLVTAIIVPIGLSAVAVMCGEIAAAIAAGQPLLAYAATSQLLIATRSTSLRQAPRKEFAEPLGRDRPQART